MRQFINTENVLAVHRKIPTVTSTFPLSFEIHNFLTQELHCQLYTNDEAEGENPIIPWDQGRASFLGRYLKLLIISCEEGNK